MRALTKSERIWCMSPIPIYRMMVANTIKPLRRITHRMTEEEYTRPRSAFWMLVKENDNESWLISASQGVSNIIKHHFPDLDDASPRGWQDGNTNTEYVWIPKDRADEIDITSLEDWAQFAGKQCIWLKLGNHLKEHFSGSELEYCIAVDFNFTVSRLDTIEAHSVLGEAENKLKYHAHELSPSRKQSYFKLMTDALLRAFDLLPIRDLTSPHRPLVSAVPSRPNSNRLASQLARHVAETKGLEFIEPRLTIKKGQMKELALEKKIERWCEIYSKEDALTLDPSEIEGRTVVIVDDLYQSGITMWSYAKALKELGASNVYGLACVKSMRDTDNE